jgi:lambda family phage portal protein
MDWYQPMKPYGPIAQATSPVSSQPAPVPMSTKSIAIPEKVTSKTTSVTNAQAAVTDLFETALWDSFTGSKFYGGFGKTSIFNDDTINYEMLRIRSKQLFVENLYARGLINRIADNVINTGLTLQTAPENEILDLDETTVQEWSDKIEATFKLWAGDPLLIDFQKKEDFDLLQWSVYLTALVSGDCLVRLRTPTPINLPTIEIIDGASIKTPMLKTRNNGNKIKHGVEYDSKGRQIAFWYQKDSFGKFERIPAFGEKSKRRIAWLVYGTKQMIDNTRGISLLACALQALKEVDRYTDSEVRAAVLNSIITAFIERTPGEIPSSQPFHRAAPKNKTEEYTQDDGTTKDVSFSEFLPGVMMDKLNPGEKPVSFDTKRPNTNYKEFVRAILAGVAFGQGLPPEIYFLEFQNNFSASRQASNEFNQFLRLARSFVSKQFHQLYYIEWLTQYALLGKTMMPGYVEALQDPQSWEIKNAWRKAVWVGVARPSVDPLKEVKALVTAENAGYMSKSDVVTEYRGDDYDKVLRRRASEQEKEKEAGLNQPVIDTSEDSETDETEIEAVTRDGKTRIVALGA